MDKCVIMITPPMLNAATEEAMQTRFKRKLSRDMIILTNCQHLNTF